MTFYNSIEPYWNNWKGEKMNFYKMLWSKIGGRKWTHIYRDFYHTVPYVVQLIWFNVGLWIGLNFGWKQAYLFWAIYTLGFIYGHFHWGKMWIKGQGKEGYE